MLDRNDALNVTEVIRFNGEIIKQIKITPAEKRLQQPQQVPYHRPADNYKRAV